MAPANPPHTRRSASRRDSPCASSRASASKSSRISMAVSFLRRGRAFNYMSLWQIPLMQASVPSAQQTEPHAK
jgi:hypothetical protein